MGSGYGWMFWVFLEAFQIKYQDFIWDIFHTLLENKKIIKQVQICSLV
jgi:hypothetical protein